MGAKSAVLYISSSQHLKFEIQNIKKYPQWKKRSFNSPLLFYAMLMLRRALMSVSNTINCNLSARAGEKKIGIVQCCCEIFCIEFLCSCSWHNYTSRYIRRLMCSYHAVVADNRDFQCWMVNVLYVFLLRKVCRHALSVVTMTSGLFWLKYPKSR